ncbi:hypothetical protein KXD97_29770 [Mycobacterium sp. SMC-8]|uniref:hypothetical protein n=1 Tax=Mycobacterium sp. SMC-8 TaxID=2857060 RepID=UPI0021B2D410|nr:hypothetical protein [Mycobacterium sp. SMC-8]UXA12060.1 hypothetical protein KXD97_29770 [Mycobacterium sp. SMC-8]
MIVKDETDDAGTTPTALVVTDDQSETGATDTGELVEAADVDDETDSETETFSRTYVEKLRRENAGYRERANSADALAQRLHTALVAATGRMADPTDLPFDAIHLDDEDALTTAIDELLAKKPHLASRRVSGDIGQGNRGSAADAPVNLADILRARA